MFNDKSVGAIFVCAIIFKFLAYSSEKYWFRVLWKTLSSAMLGLWLVGSLHISFSLFIATILLLVIPFLSFEKLLDGRYKYRANDDGMTNGFWAERVIDTNIVPLMREGSRRIDSV